LATSTSDTTLATSTSDTTLATSTSDADFEFGVNADFTHLHFHNDDFVRSFMHSPSQNPYNFDDCYSPICNSPPFVLLSDDEHATTTTSAISTTTTTTAKSTIGTPTELNELLAWIESFMSLLKKQINNDLIVEKHFHQIQEMQQKYPDSHQFQEVLCKHMMNVFQKHICTTFQLGANNNSSLSLSSLSSSSSTPTASSNAKKRKRNQQMSALHKKSKSHDERQKIVETFQQLKTIKDTDATGCDYECSDNRDRTAIRFKKIGSAMMARLIGSTWYLVFDNLLITLRLVGPRGGGKQLNLQVLLNEKSSPLWVNDNGRLIPSKALLSDAKSLSCLQYSQETRSIVGMLWCTGDAKTQELYIYNLALYLKKPIPHNKLLMVEDTTTLDEKYKQCTFLPLHLVRPNLFQNIPDGLS
jgi:hypothetical protein